MCNDRKRFKFKCIAHEDDILVTGKAVYAIKAFGTIEITAKVLNGPIIIKLLNVALTPRFMTNLVCLRRFAEKGVY